MDDEIMALWKAFECMQPMYYRGQDMAGRFWFSDKIIPTECYASLEDAVYALGQRIRLSEKQSPDYQVGYTDGRAGKNCEPMQTKAYGNGFIAALLELQAEKRKNNST